VGVVSFRALKVLGKEGRGVGCAKGGKREGPWKERGMAKKKKETVRKYKTRKG